MKTETYRAVPWQRMKNKKIFSKIKKRILSLQAKSIPFFPQKRTNTPSGARALPCVFQKGSLTAEAAMVVPVFLLAMLAVLCMMGVYQRQLSELEKLEQTAEKTAVSGYAAGVKESKGALVKYYRYKPAITFTGAKGMSMVVEVRVRPWIGYQGDLKNLAENGRNTEIVYVSDNKDVYHTHADCSYLEIHLTKTTVSRAARMRNDYGEKYTPCERCGASEASGTVYVSPKGDHYHTSTHCSGISKSPSAVLKSDVGNLPLCTRCSKRGAA